MKTILFSLLIFLGTGAMAQESKAVKQYHGKVKYQKTETDATIFELPYPASQVEDGMKDLAEKQGAKVREKNGFYEAKNVKVDKLGGQRYDIYYKVDRAGKGESKLSMIVANPGEDLLTRSSTHAEIVGAAAGGAAIMASVAPHLDDHDFSLLKTRQEDEIKKAERKLAELQDDEVRMQKKITDLQKELEKNKQDQKNANAELQSRKSTMKEVLDKRASLKKN